MSRSAIYPKDRPRPRCVFCRVHYASILDHKEPHLGDPDRFWNGPFQTLCKRCHDSTKQVHERRNLQRTDLDGYRMNGSGPQDWVSWDDLHEPKDIKPSAPSLTMIFGPPGSGKTSYVRRYAKVKDEIVDADVEARRLGYDRYTQITIERINILKARNEAFRELSSSRAKRAWSTGLGARANVRGHWIKLLKPKKVIVLLTPAQKCIERIKMDDSRTHKNRQIAAVNKWFKEYELRGGEVVIR